MGHWPGAQVPESEAAVSTYTALDAERVRQSVGAIIAQYPELAEDDVLRADMLEAETSLNEMLARLVREANEAAMMVKAIEDLVEVYKARAGRMGRRHSGFRALILKLMQAADLRKVELPAATLSTRAIPPKLVIDDEDAIPEVWRVSKVTSVIDRLTIRAALDDGRTIPGAHLSNGDVGLTVRVK